jgi:hypothetical protein
MRWFDFRAKFISKKPHLSRKLKIFQKESPKLVDFGQNATFTPVFIYVKKIDRNDFWFISFSFKKYYYL